MENHRWSAHSAKTSPEDETGYSLNKKLGNLWPQNVFPFYWPPFAEKEQSHNATSSRGTTTLKVLPCCICWIAAFWWLIVSWPTKAVKTWSNTSHQAGKPKKITRQLSSTILGWGRFLVAGSYLQRVSLGDGEPATLPVGSWAASFWDENLLFH